MKKYIIILLVLLLLLIFNNSNECFEDNIYDSPNCCVIRSQRISDNYKYYYYPSQNCDNLNNNVLRTIKEDELIDGQPFIMDNCKSENNIFGSCKQLGAKACVDFISREDCSKYPGMVWEKDPCRNNLEIQIYHSYNNPVPDSIPFNEISDNFYKNKDNKISEDTI
jgi:hypothetical protein